MTLNLLSVRERKSEEEVIQNQTRPALRSKGILTDPPQFDHLLYDLQTVIKMPKGTGEC